MVNKIIIYITLIVMMLLIVGISINWYISQQEFPNEMCWKGKYLVKIEDEGSVYTRLKQFSCEQDGKIIILEEV